MAKLFTERRLARRLRQLDLVAKVAAAEAHLGVDVAKASGNIGLPPGVSGATAITSPQQHAQALAQQYRLASFPATPDDIQQSLVGQGMDQTVAFAPGRPLQPNAGYSVPARKWDYPTGYNLTTRPREQKGRISFDTLASIYDTYDVAGICVNHRIDDVRSLEWRIVAADGITTDVTSQVQAGRKAVEKPDGTTPYATWLAMWLRDTLQYDAGTLQRGRLLNGKVAALEVVDGKTIAPMLDFDGRRPASPAPAFVQFVNGLPWDWLTDEDLIYSPFWPTSNSPYGKPPMETLLLNANTDIRFQWYFLQYFTEGSVPDTFMEAPPDMSDPAQIEEFQQTWDAIMEGDQAQKHKVRWVPAGAKPTQMREDAWQDTFPLFLMRKTCAAHGVVPADLGFTEDVNKASGDTQIDVQFRVSTTPLIQHVETMINGYLHDDLGLDKIKFEIDDGQEKEDRLAEAQAWQIYCEIGAASPDEPREQVLGLPVDPANPVPRTITTRTGLVPVKSIMQVSGEVDSETAAPVPGSVDITPGAGNSVVPLVMSPLAPAKPGMPAAPNEPNEPETPADRAEVEGTDAAAEDENDPFAKEATAGVTTATGITSVDLVGRRKDDDDDDEPDEEDIAKALRRWRDNSRSRLRKGMRPRRFVDANLPADLENAVWADLQKATTREGVDEAFTKATHPKGDARPGPGGHLEAKLIDTYTALIHEALTAGLDPAKLAAFLTSPENTWGKVVKDEAVRPEDIQPPALDVDPQTVLPTVMSWMAAQQPAEKPVLRVIQGALADGYVAGADEGTQLSSAAGLVADATTAAITGLVDWDDWTPGDPELGDRLGEDAGDGWKDLLEAAGHTIKDVTDTQMTRIGTAIAEAVSEGQSVDELTATLTGIVGDMSQAQMISTTEVARAMTAGALDSYQAIGIDEWDLLDSAGACPVCAAVKDANPHPLTDAAPPLHPRCRCAAAPHVTIPGQE